ncbi:MAG: hypothetical protein QOJ20_931 [Mycobacterium sp.]|jgi:hypothetical protein|nr:hypothetical protein [Mycobacterium sp.]
MTAGTTADVVERRKIREAMDRLLDGKPLHSDGKLTIKGLAKEARIRDGSSLTVTPISKKSSGHVSPAPTQTRP